MTGMLDLPAQIQNKIIPEPNSGCWLWIGGLDYGGYGQWSVNSKTKIITKKAHRVVYEFYKGVIPNDLQLDHLCRVRCCVNPDHLEPVTGARNIQRGNTGLTNSLKTHCLRGHPYSEENTHYRFVRGRCERRCRACAKIHWKHHYERYR
jgi:hypothetical protein